MNLFGNHIEDWLVESLWRHAENLRSFYTWQMYTPAIDLLRSNSMSYELAYPLVRRLVSKWKREGRLIKIEGSKRNSKWEVIL